MLFQVIYGIDGANEDNTKNEKSGAELDSQKKQSKDIPTEVNILKNY